MEKVIIRTLVYRGPASDVDRTLERSLPDGLTKIGNLLIESSTVSVTLPKTNIKQDDNYDASQTGEQVG